VTAAKALDYIFLQENLFFQKVGPRTILVASNTRRVNFQQLVLRTFYLSNANPKDVKTVIQTAIPAQPGRSQTIVLEDAATNSITVRDTEENVRLIGKLISSLDKDRAEVVMDVAIYEVNKNDLLQWGNQIGSASSLVNLGGTSSAVVGLGGNDNYGNAAANAARGITNAAKAVMPYAFGAGIILPAANLSAFQSKTNTKLIASTQIHAFNNEDSSARIGQRVPVKTAQVQTGNAVGGGAVVSDVINYEQVGLTLKFKPLVFPNQDVQVAMEIESKDVNGVSGQDLLPTFTERTIKGTARVQNNKTLLLASVAQGVESNGRSGLPILGLIPILGNLFTAPTKDNRQVDIVIAITPKVIRAPAILPEDEIERPTGTLQTPTNSSLEAMVEQEARDEMLASARRVPNQAQVQLPDQPADAPQYVRGATTTSGAVAQNDNAPTGATSTNGAQPAPSTLQPIDSGVKTLQIKQTADTSAAGQPVVQPVDNATADPGPKPQVSISLPSELPTLKPGERAKIAVTASNSAAFRSAVLGLRYDSSKFAVRSVEYGDIFGGGVANTAATPFLNEKGKTNVSFSLPQGTVAAGNGILAYIEVEALSEGRPQITFDKDVMNFLTAEGRNFVVSF
jgi:general secretion pathway protein D